MLYNKRIQIYEGGINMLSIYNENEWIYPDTQTREGEKVYLYTAQNGYIGFQCIIDEEEEFRLCHIEVKWKGKSSVETEVFNLVAVTVDENTDSDFMTTTDYERCKSFVTRQAPFQVYDCLVPWKEDVDYKKRIPLYVQFKVGVGDLGKREGIVEFVIEDKAKQQRTVHANVELQVYDKVLPKPEERKLGVMNFFCYENIAKDHEVVYGSEEYWQFYRIYVQRQLEMHCTHIMLPCATPILDEKKQVIDFDFNQVIKAGEIALEEGAPFIVGACIAHWGEWTDEGYYLLWEPSTGAESLEGYYQLKKYFSKWKKIVDKKDWQGRIMQSLADEPQVHNALSYRAIASVFRKCVPGVKIIEAVEALNLGGGIDIWVPKQDTYEKYIEDFENIRSAGEEMWYYTCAFPAGKIMNRSMDLPLVVSRYIMWMVFYYGLSGFLHWGFNYYIGDNVYEGACCPHKGKKLPAGDAHIVYPGERQVYRSMRYIAQRAGAQDYELFIRLSLEEQEAIRILMKQACSSFREYEVNVEKFEQVRKRMLEGVEVKGGR